MSAVTPPIRELVRGIRSGAIDCVELVERHLARIAAHNPALNALRFVNDKEALKLAKIRRDEAKKGVIRGRLHGVTFSVKDHIDVAGLPRSEGTLHGATASASSTAAVVRKLLHEGAICIGKGNMAEYGKSYFTESAGFGRTCNPYDPTRSPGGSGGGDSAAVAAGFASFGLGADSGGSVRVPASFCGIYGLYPTRGSISEASMTSRCHTISTLFRSLGPMAPYLDDIEILLGVTSGFDPDDPYSVEAPSGAPSHPPTKRFAFFDALNGVRADTEICGSLASTVKALEAAGYRGEAFTPPELERCFEIFIILAAQAALIVEDRIALDAGTPRDLATEGPILKNLRKRVASELPPLTVESLLKCWRTVDELRHRTGQLFEKYDFFISPVAATLPVKHGTSSYDIDGTVRQSQEVYQFASAPNVLGLPAIAFPTGKSKNGLPIGLQAIGPRFGERMLIRALEEAGLREMVEPPKLA